jgi:hypothetical protein
MSLIALVVELVDQLGGGVRFGRVVLILDVQLEGLVTYLDPALGVDLVLAELVTLLSESPLSSQFAGERDRCAEVQHSCRGAGVSARVSLRSAR